MYQPHSINIKHPVPTIQYPTQTPCIPSTTDPGRSLPSGHHPTALCKYTLGFHTRGVIRQLPCWSPVSLYSQIFLVSTKYFFKNFALIFFLNFRRACTHDPHWLHVRGRAAADPVRGGGRHPDRARQLRPLQHRHLQRRRQDPLERQLHVPQDTTHPPEQVSFFFSLQHKL